ncbi:hypothetical protein CGK42_22965 [Vibrio parahaemolyticus]|uniref:NUDIX domain-containing protein n=1 Tax=Vibrio parahaemolyticus TaxID=670 RepID=UPI0011245508|nr:NUDIX domain-containing protein [Vibrio parahaemolyticus]TNZ67004.1 hypothetical protein CGK42_22965 [Vibrio parahaemolyticus]
MQKQRVSALLVNRENAEILLIKRVKDSRIYWVFPGGGVESRELLTQAIVREVFEETSLEVDVPEEIFAVVNRGRKEHFLQACRFLNLSYHRKALNLTLKIALTDMN